jgi:hypothetical protein
MRFIEFLCVCLLIGIAFSSGCTNSSSQTSSNVQNLSKPVSTSINTQITTIITEVPQVTLTTIPIIVQTPRGITSDDVKTHFMDLAFGVGSSTINKNIPLEISSDSASNSDKELIEKFILEFNDLSKSGRISENIKVGEMAALKIKFIPQQGMKDISNYDKMFKSNDIIISKITPNVIYVNNNLMGDQRNHTILRSLYYSLGVKGETLSYPDSLFYSDDNNNSKLSLIDKKAVEILFGEGVYNGMSVDDIKKIIYLK